MSFVFQCVGQLHSCKMQCIYIYENFAKNLTTLCLRKMVLGSDNTNGFFSTDEDLARCANIVQDRE